MDSWSKAAEHHSSGKPSHQDHTAQATINLHKNKTDTKPKKGQLGMYPSFIRMKLASRPGPSRSEDFSIDIEDFIPGFGLGRVMSTIDEATEGGKGRVQLGRPIIKELCELRQSLCSDCCIARL